MPFHGRCTSALPSGEYVIYTMHQFTLPKTERLYLRESISELFANGASFTAFPYRVVYLIKEEAMAEAPSSPQNELRQGRCAIMAIAPKKRFKHAVDRNRVKRLTREAYRLQKLPLLSTLEARHKQLMVAFLYVDNKHISFDETYAILGKAITRLVKIIEKS